MKKILFVCTGNTCRSPMAEAIFNQIASDKGLDAVAKSAGVAASDGLPASRWAIEAVKQYGAALSGHESKKLTVELLSWADEVYCMSAGHIDAIKHICPESNVSLLSDRDIADPYGGGLRKYKLAAEQIAGAAHRIAEAIND